MEWIFAGITVAAALIATFGQNMRSAVLALWVAGLGVGGIYLTIGAEFLAIVQWIVSTLLTITFVFFAVMFGEYHSAQIQRTKQEWVLVLLSTLSGIGFSFVIWLGSKELSFDPSILKNNGIELKVLGQILIEKNFISLEVLALTLFLVLVGGGVVARFERSDSQ